MNKGIIAINKPQNWTSFDVVNKIKHMVKPLKVGHLGTLDPMATGVLLVTVGKATKLFDIMQAKQKTYVATFKFGEETDTLDATGKVINTTTYIPTLREIESVLPKFIGKISQIPPKYSAKSVNGVRAYDLARTGVEFELKPKEVNVSSIKIVEYNKATLKLEIVCGSGTYIRSIGRDIAYCVNSLATMTYLVRTQVGKFSLEKCQDINNLDKENVLNSILPISSVLDYSSLNLNKEETFKLLNGQTLIVNFNDGNYLLTNDGEELAIVKISNNKAKMSIFLG